jgi:hypothetical protein
MPPPPEANFGIVSAALPSLPFQVSGDCSATGSQTRTAKRPLIAHITNDGSEWRARWSMADLLTNSNRRKTRRKIQSGIHSQQP